jgi:hypothetical protein
MLSTLVLAAAIGAGPEILHTETDAVIGAAIDASTAPATYVRYVWNADADKDVAAAVSFAVNTAISKATTIQRLESVAGGRLIRIDFERLCPKDADLKRALQLWDRLAEQDRAFYIREHEATAPYVAEDGKTYRHKWKVAFGSQCGIYTGPDTPPDMKECVRLTVMTKTQTPIVRANRLVVKSLSQIDGGFYYQVAGIRKSQKAGRTDFEQFLIDRGVDPEKAKELRAERRFAVLMSGVTGKPRAGEEVQGLLGVVVYTNDVADDNRNPMAHPVLTLLEPKFDAIEAIAIRANGMCDFALFNGKGELQDVVPDNIARDHTIPSPYTSRLQPAISCIRCHKTGKGFRTTRNDVQAILKAAPESGLKFDIVGDDRFKDSRDVLDRLAGLYRGNMDRLNRGREDYSDAVFLATGGLSVEAVAGHIQEIQDYEQFSEVTAQRMCRYLGVGVSEDEAVPLLRKLLHPETAPGGREDARIGFLKAGLSITTQDADEILPDALIRSRSAYHKLAKERKGD